MMQHALAITFILSLAVIGHLASISGAHRRRAPSATNVLSSKGHPLHVPTFPHVIEHEGMRVAVQGSNIKRVPRADGDEAMQHVLDKLDLTSVCQSDPTTWVIDVGGLYGDFGLSSGRRGCRTMIFEPQKGFAERIARSVLLNDMVHLVEVHYAALSPKEHISFAKGKSAGGLATVLEASATDSNLIPTEQLDSQFSDRDTILLLKVDVEGNEDEVWKTATNLFQQGRILNAIFEYTPNQFKGRGTDYETFLPRLFNAGAKVCYALHRTKEKLFRIPKDRVEQFYHSMHAIRMQTDIYCAFGNQVDVFQHAPDWTPRTSLVT